MPNEPVQTDVDMRLTNIERQLEMFASQIAAVSDLGNANDGPETESYRQREEIIRLLERIAVATESSASQQHSNLMAGA